MAGALGHILFAVQIYLLSLAAAGLAYGVVAIWRRLFARGDSDIIIGPPPSEEVEIIGSEAQGKPIMVEIPAELLDVLMKQQLAQAEIIKALTAIHGLMDGLRSDLGRHLTPFQGVANSVAKIQRLLEDALADASPDGPSFGAKSAIQATTPPAALSPHKDPPATGAWMPERDVSDPGPAPPSEIQISRAIKRWIEGGGGDPRPITNVLGKDLHSVKFIDGQLRLSGPGTGQSDSELFGWIDGKGALQILVGPAVAGQYRLRTRVPALEGELGEVFDLAQGSGFIACGEATPIAGTTDSFVLQTRGKLARMSDA